MALDGPNMRTALATAFGANAPYMALYSTVPSGAAGTELTGGAPAYARKALTWGTAAASVITATAVVFDVPSGATVAGGGFHTAVTAGNYQTGFSVTSQTFASQGTYTVTPTYTQS
jgi:hypothetical protein